MIKGDETKADILNVGTVNDDGTVVRDWYFDCRGVIGGISLNLDGPSTYAGWTVEELREIEREARGQG